MITGTNSPHYCINSNYLNRNNQKTLHVCKNDFQLILLILINFQSDFNHLMLHFSNIMHQYDSQQPLDSDGQRILDTTQLTPLEKQEAEQARKQHRLNMTKKQRQFKGERAFIAKPAQIAFPNFTVGKPHYLIITLTNVSNAFNSFNVLPLPEKIRNYFEVEYTPKGKISPGITCDIRFKFFPQLNEDIESEFTILAQTGKISFPIICSSRKTIVRCDNPTMDFQKIIYGQSKKIKLSIRNEGSLPSQYCFMNLNNTEIGIGNSEQQLKVINNLSFERKGQIEGNCEKVISFEFKPTELGFFSLQLLLSIKNVLYSPPIVVSFQAECIEVPVRIERQLYDFQICLLGHIYREKLTFYNKSENPMSFKMLQAVETKKYIEFNPVIGYIQKESSIDVWIKFTADKDILIYLNKFMTDKNVYVIPFQMSLKEQALPVQFQIKFKITTDKINIRPAELSFGKIFQGLSSKIQVQFENESELPQQILIHPLKKSISIENDQPLFKLLPLQTIKTFITYKSKQLDDNGKTYKEQDYIGCKIITGQISTSKLDLHYTCEITRADLSISQNKIDLPALQVAEIVQAATTITNNTNKQLLFEIFVPDVQLCGLIITPVVKTLPAKQQVQINIQYHSFFKKLSPSLLQKVAQKKLKIEPVQQKKVEEAAVQKKENKKQAKKETKLTKQQQEQLEQEQKRLEEEERLRKLKQEQDRLQIERNFDAVAELAKLGAKCYDFGETTQHYQWLLPVYFKQKDYSDVSAEVNFLQITTTSISQVLCIDKNELDFGEIAVGTRAVRELTILNKGETAELKKKNMPIFCSFNVLNSMKTVQNNKSFRAVVQFQPIEQQRFQQRLQFYTEKYTVSCVLKGKGVRPEVQIEPESGLLNMGGVLVEEFSEKTIKIKNICNFQINFTLQKIGNGINNSNSASAFTYIPSQGSIPAHGTVEVKVRFKPDRITEKYFQKIKVHVEQQKSIKYFYVTGASYPRQAYIANYIAPAMPENQTVAKKIQYAFDSLRVKDENTVFGPNNRTIILEYTRIIDTAIKDEKCTQRKIVVGSCRLLDSKLEKPTNFQVLMPKDDRFQCDNLKGVANAGSEVVITFTYKPEQVDPLITSIPALAGMGQWRELKIEVKLSGGFVKPATVDAISYEVILRFYVNQL